MTLIGVCTVQAFLEVNINNSDGTQTRPVVLKPSTLARRFYYIHPSSNVAQREVCEGMGAVSDALKISIHVRVNVFVGLRQLEATLLWPLCRLDPNSSENA